MPLDVLSPSPLLSALRDWPRALRRAHIPNLERLTPIYRARALRVLERLDTLAVLLTLAERPGLSLNALALHVAPPRVSGMYNTLRIITLPILSEVGWLTNLEQLGKTKAAHRYRLELSPAGQDFLSYYLSGLEAADDGLP
ncbi:hypothetical protein [Neomegalonema perideroedes]|uniref:hypothetical protein n=1 Tax=Neomegalonema perideroedes TaxID=217219 RepID=UPI00037375D8|nr:hypothetical protein [Neomegalonema perideroedes]